MNFSRRKDRQPSPPSPLFTSTLASSRNRTRIRPVDPRSRGSVRCRPAAPSATCASDLAGRHDVDVGAASRAVTEGDAALGEREQGVVAAETDAGAGMEAGAALADDDVAGNHQLAAVLLDAQPPAGAVAAVARAAAGLLVRHCRTTPAVPVRGRPEPAS